MKGNICRKTLIHLEVVSSLSLIKTNLIKTMISMMIQEMIVKVSQKKVGSSFWEMMLGMMMIVIRLRSKKIRGLMSSTV